MVIAAPGTHHCWGDISAAHGGGRFHPNQHTLLLAPISPGERTGSCWGYDLKWDHRRPSKGAQNNPITSPFSPTLTRGALAAPKPQCCQKGTADAGDTQPWHRRDRRCLLD